MAGKRDYYEVLGVARDAGASDLKRAYRQLAMENHPDRNPGDGACEERFKEAAEAYEVLSNADKRAAYDRFGHDGLRGQGPGFSGVEDIFDQFSSIFGDFFGGGRGGARGGRRAGGADLEMALHLPFADIIEGVSKEVSVSRRVACDNCSGSGAKPGTSADVCGGCQGRGQVMHSQGFFMIATTCPQCRGQGRIIRERCGACVGEGRVPKKETLSVDIPAGVESGQTLRVTGKGEPAPPPGGPAGNLYIRLEVEDDERFIRDGADVLTEVPVSFATAALGGEVTVPTLDEGATGETVVDVEPGSQFGTLVVRRGEGLPLLGRRGKGDHIIRLLVSVPKKMSDEQKDALRAYATAMGEELKEPKRGLFGRKKRKSRS